MRSLLRAAANEWGWLKAAPIIKTKKPISKRIRWLTREEANQLIDCMPESIKPVVIFALSTDLNRSNILDLEWTQVEMQRKVAWINPENAKAGKAIGVALNDTTCKVREGANREAFSLGVCSHKAQASQRWDAGTGRKENVQ